MTEIIYVTVVDISKKNGQGIYALKVLESFVSRKDNHVIVICPKPKNYEIIRNALSEHDFDIIHLLRKKKNRSVIWHLLVQIQLMYILMMIGRKKAILYSLKPVMFAPIIYSKIFRVPIYLLVEGLAKNTIATLAKGTLRRIGLYLLYVNIKWANRVYPAYISAKEWVDQIRQKKDSKIIYCGVDEKIFRPLTPQKTEKLTIGYVGSFRKIHLLEQLFEAIQDMDVELQLIGEGPEKRKLEQLYKSKNFKARVLFIGEKEQKDLPFFYSRCDIMWAATDVDHWGVPIKCFEYLACNKRVIYTHKEDFKFITDHEFGFLLRRNDTDEIRSLVLMLQQKFTKGLLENRIDSRSYIVNNMSWVRFPEIILDDVQKGIK